MSVIAFIFPFDINLKNILEIDEYGLGIANGYESRIVVTPVIARASDAVRNIPMKIRQCLFESENFLDLYR